MEPRWKTLLNYGAIIMFLTMPLVVGALQIYALHNPGWLSAELPREEFRHLIEFQRALAFLVFSLAGLKTWETVKRNGHSDHNHQITTS